MDKFIGSGKETAEELVELLTNTCDEVVEGSYFRRATVAELQDAAEMISDFSIKLGVLEDEKTEYMTNHKAKVKPLRLDLKAKIDLKKHKGQQVKGQRLFKMIDHEEGMVGLYAQNGELIEERRIMEDERNKQTNIIGQIRSMGNGGPLG